MSSVTKSARAIPRCRGCGQPTKGHSGPTGITKCQNQQQGGDVNQNADIGNQNLGTTVVEPVKVLQFDSTKLEILTEVEGAQENDQTNPFDDPVLVGKIGHCIASLCLEDEANEASKKAETEDKQESAQLNPSSEGNSEDFLSQSTLEDLESLLKRDEKQLIKKRVAPARVESSSDSDVDIRKVIAGKSFLLCECAIVNNGRDCKCEGLLRFNNELQGELVNFIMDPLTDDDIFPSVGSSRSVWEKENPNEMVLSVDPVASSISSSEGDMQMKAFRYAEIIKGKKVMYVEVEAKIDLLITFNKSCMEEDFRLSVRTSFDSKRRNMADSVAENLPTVRADSVTENLTTAPVPQEIFPNSFPCELFKFIFEHSNVVTLMQLSATSRRLRLQVHSFFTSRLSDQAKKYPEIRDSLSRLGWTKEHNPWACDCFKLVAGPGFTWRHLKQRKSFSKVYTSADCETACTTVAGKTFLITSDKEVIFFENSTDNNMMPSSAHSLVSFKSSPIVIGSLSSYDQVLSFSLKEPMPNVRHALSIYNPTTLSKITEIDLIAYDNKIPEDIRNVEVTFISFAKDTMAIHLEGDGRNILMWKINTTEPKEEGIAFLQTFAPSPNFLSEIFLFGTFRLNDRFIAILEDTHVEVRNRSDGALVCFMGREVMIAWALEKEGDHIAFAVPILFNVAHPKLLFQIYSVTRGHVIIQKELDEWPFPAVRYMKWFGPHLVVILQRDNVLSMMSWQPGLTSFLPCPLNVPVVRRSSRGGGGESEWDADCVHVDFGGITIALRNSNGIWDLKNHMWRYE